MSVFKRVNFKHIFLFIDSTLYDFLYSFGQGKLEWEVQPFPSLKPFSPSVSVDTPSLGFPPRSQPILPQPPLPAPLSLPAPFVDN